MPWESCWFVARPGWAAVLKKMSKVHELWQEAEDEGYVDFEDDWRPFPELLPFARLDSTLQLGEGLGLVAALYGVAPPTHESLATTASQLLMPPRLKAAQQEVCDTLEYEWMLEWPEDVRSRHRALDALGQLALAERWKAAPGPQAMGSSADIGRQVNFLLEVERLHAFFERSREFMGAPVLWVGRNVA